MSLARPDHPGGTIPRLLKGGLAVVALFISAVIAPSPLPAAAPPGPRVLGWTPDVIRDVPVGATLTVYFNQEMDNLSVERAWHLFPAVPGILRSGGMSVSFVPGRALRAGTWYRLSIDSGARAASGAHLAPSFSVAFRTGDGLRVQSVSPTRSTSAVPVYALIAVTFNHPMVALAGLSAGARNPPGWRVSISPATPGYGSWLGTSTWVFHPAAGLRPSRQYAVGVRGTARDAWGEALGRDFRWSFRTVGPEVVGESPGNGASFVDPRTRVAANFNQPMERAATARAFSLTVGGARVPGTVTWQGRTLVFRPAAPLTSRAAYLVRIGREARSAESSASLGRGVSWRFHVAPAPAVVGTEPAPGGTTYGVGCVNRAGFGCRIYIPSGQGDTYAVDLSFNTPMSKRSLDRQLVIRPSVTRFDTYLWGPDNDGTFPFGISGDFLPSTVYTIRIGAAARDRFGRALGVAYTLRFKTARVAPSVALYGMPGQGEGIAFSAGQVREAPVQVINVPSVKYTLKRTTLAALATWQNSGFGSGPLYPAGHTVRSWSEPEPHRLNTVENVTVRLAAASGAPLAPGLYWLGAETPPGLPGLPPGSDSPSSSEIVDVTNAGVTLKTGSNGTLAWVTDARTGRPLRGARVRLVDYQGRSLTSGHTNWQGLHFFPRSFPQGPPNAVVDDGGHFGMTKGYWQPQVDRSDTSPGGPASGLSPQYGPSSGGTYLYTDRPVYRPGQAVHFRAVLWRDRDGVYSPLAGSRAHLQVNDSRGRPLYRAQQSVDRFGTVQGSLRLPGNTPTGYDFVSVWIPHSVGTSGNFLVAEYRKPEFLTTVRAGRARYVQGQTATATVRVRYVFGAPVVHRRVSWVAYSQPRYSQPPGWDRYSFFDWTTYYQQIMPWWKPAPRMESQLGAVVARGSGTTDGGGRLAIRIPVNLLNQPLDQDVTLEATATDLNNQSVSGRVQVAEYRSAFALGMAPQQQVVPAGSQETVDVAAVRPDGAAVPEQAVTASIFQRTYTSKLVNNGGNQSEWQPVPHDALLVTRHLRTGAHGLARLRFTPARGGEYRVVVRGKDQLGNTVQNALSIFASAEGFSDWGVSNNTVIALKPDRTSYRVGETAHVLVTSPFDRATALVTLERNGIRMYRVQQLATNSSRVDIPITLDDLPNVYVTVAVYRGWRNGSPPDWRYGVTNLHVNLDPRHIVVRLSQSGSHHHPGDRIAYTVTTTDARGHPVSAQLSLALVDTAVLALQTENSPDIVAALYGERSLGVSTASDGVLSIDHLQTQPNFQVQPLGGLKRAPVNAAAPLAGGGGGGGGQAITVRSRFADTAYWAAGVVTDRSGRATLRLKLPDNATTWRLDARALTAETGVGQARLLTRCTQDIIVRPVTPRFLVQGDELRLGTAVNNTLSRPVPVTVSLAARGLRLSGRTSVSLLLPARGERLVLWPARVTSSGAVRLMFRAVPRIRGVRGDAVLLGLPVRAPLTDETVAASGQVFGAVKQVVVVPRDALPAPGALTVQVSSSITAGLGAAYADFRPTSYESNEDVADRVQVAAALRGVPAALPGLAPSTRVHLPHAIAAGVRKLLDHQLYDGGWPWFNGPWEVSDPAITADAIQALTASGSRSGAVRAAVGQARQYLRSQLGQVSPAERAYLLQVLARSGAASRRATEALYASSVVRSHLDVGAMAYLADALRLGRDAGKGQSIASLLDSHAEVSATGAHWEGAAWDVFSQPAVATTAAVLGALLSVSPHDPVVPAAARWLMLARSGAGWDCPHDTAQAVVALAAYARAAREGRADYRYRVLVNGTGRLTGRYHPSIAPASSTLRIPVAWLRRGVPNDVVIDREGQNGTVGTGPLYYVARMRYFLHAAGIQARTEGASVTRQYLTMRGTPIHGARAGTPIQVRLTIHTGQTLDYVTVQDPIPAGVEPIDASLNTSQQGLFRPPAVDFIGRTQDLTWFLTHADLRDDRVSLYASYLPPGTYTYTYLEEATVPGLYGVAPTHISETFFPEVFGRSAGETFAVK